jgi:beta-aspartyl-peptidase (threonine type)
MPLGTTRIVLGWLTLAFVLVGLVSTPMYVSPAPAEQTAPLHDAGLRRLNGDLTATIEGILSRQAAAWNSGDIDGFMQHYWKSDELTFSSGGKTTRGWETTKKNYQQRYPTRERMGHLSFEAIEITSLGDSSGLVLGRWHLQREPAPVGGSFSLLFRRVDGTWVIVHDHTSRDETATTPQLPSVPPGQD